ncbi:phage holin family protein [Candidatus Desantisbacteria bacterium]|nr:phage holin family protein [Candidatus Desantisbacteria bacterium]
MKKGFILRLISNSLAIIVVAHIVDGIEIQDIWSVFIAGFFLGVVNAVIRPIILFFTLPFTVVTFGFFILIVNGAMLYITSWLVNGFEIKSFWAAFIGSILISIFSSFFNYLIGDKGGIDVIHFNTGRTTHNRTSNENKNKIIEADYEVIDEEKKQK